MSRKNPTAIELQAELLRRIMHFRESDISLHHSKGLLVNHEGGIGSKNPALQLLISKGQAEIVRRNSGRTKTTARPRRHWSPPPTRNYSLAILKGPRPPKVELTCPCCGELFARPAWDSGKWITKSFGDYHKYDCQLRTDHSTWRNSRRQTQVANGLKGRTARPIT